MSWWVKLSTPCPYIRSQKLDGELWFGAVWSPIKGASGYHVIWRLPDGRKIDVKTKYNSHWVKGCRAWLGAEAQVGVRALAREVEE